MSQFRSITIEATIEAPLSQVWEAWTTPESIMKWNFADASWHCPSSENDLRPGGKFKNRMEARDGSFGFDFEGVYDTVAIHKEITYTMADGRQVTTLFSDKNGNTLVQTTFDADEENSTEMQKQGWQAILNSFVNYVETKN